MSYPYRVVVSRSVEETVSSKDESRNRISLTPILPPARMGELFRKALGRSGFAEREDGRWIRSRDGVTEVFDPARLVFAATAEAAGEIRKERTVEVRGDALRPDEVEPGKRHAEAEVGAKLEKELKVTDAERARKAEELLASARQSLERTEAARVRSLNEATLEAYAEAIKEKARSLGEVKEIREQRREAAAPVHFNGTG